jgi:general secretion pathway protein J
MALNTNQVSGQSALGFTLLEVLIAIVITALIGLGSWQLLNSAIRTNEITQRSLEELAQVQKAVHFITKDMEQLVPRAIRDEYGDYQASITTGNDFYTVEFSRIGWRNPLQDRRSEVQRVAYELNDGDLLRHYWTILDRAQDSEPKTMLLLERVESFEVAFLNDSDAWVDSWPPSNDQGEEQVDRMLEFSALPKALRLRLEHPKFGAIERLFETVSYVENQIIQASDSGSGGQNENGDQNQGSGDQGSGNQNGGSSSGGIDNGNDVGQGSVEEISQ